MADEEENKAPAEEKKGGLPLMAIIVVAVVLIVEGAVISAFFILSSGPPEVKAQDPVDEGQADFEKTVEISVVAEKFQNARRGKPFLYDTEVVMVIKKKHEIQAKEEMTRMQNQIRHEIKTIIGRADPAQLASPDNATVTRQIRAMLEEKMPRDEEGKSIIERIIIPKIHQFDL